MEIRDVLAKNMKRLRKLKGMTQSDLAEAIGQSLTNIAHIETCRVWPPPETIASIANALDAAQTELFKNPDEIEIEPAVEAAKLPESKPDKLSEVEERLKSLEEALRKMRSPGDKKRSGTR